MTGPLVVLLRHGESTWNVENRFQGQADAPLSERGRAQVAEAARHVARAAAGRTVRLVSSDLGRAWHTAAALAEELALTVTADERLREVAAGSWQGLLQHEIAATDPRRYAAWRAGEDVALGGAETPGQAGERVRAAVAAHRADADADGTQWLVVVGHGASLRAGTAALLGEPSVRGALAGPANTAGAVLSAPATDAGAASAGAAGAWRLHGWNVPAAALAAVTAERGRAPVGVI